jgi:hypothetical protein
MSKARQEIHGFVKIPHVVAPAKVGVQELLERLDSRLRGNDRKERLPTFCKRNEIIGRR